MAREFSRARRVGEQIQRELAELIRDEVKDPRLGMVTVAHVEVSRDFAHAKVYMTVLGADEATTLENVDILNHAAGFLRHELGHRMRLRTVPQLRFIHDTSIERGSELSRLIDDAVASDRHGDDDGDED